MTESEKLKHCVGCRNDFYNQSGTTSPTGRCWMLPNMQLIQRKEVSVDQRPPWTQKAKLLPDCYCRPRFIYVGPDMTQ